jgi:protein ImuB
MDRLACVDIPAFSLQLLLRERPEWRGFPAAVVSEDSPRGALLQLNEAARDRGLLPGLHYAAALSLCPELRAGELTGAAASRGTAAAAGLLGGFSPSVEPGPPGSGVFWLDPTGLGRLHRSPAAWARALLAALLEAGFHGNVAVGFTRFGTFALARAEGGVRVLAGPEQERRAVLPVPLARLDLPGAARDGLRRLGVDTVGRLLRLPAAGLLERFGPEVHRLHREARGDCFSPLAPLRPAEPVIETAEIEPPDDDALRLTFLIKRLLGPLLRRVAARHAALAGLEIDLGTRGGGRIVERVRPAEPTLDGGRILELARLRLERLALEGGVTGIALQALTAAASPTQLELFAAGRDRHREAGDRALARLRAEFGEDAVVRARLAEGHLPEARFRLERLERLPPCPAAPAAPPGPRPVRTVVRRIRAAPLPLAGRPVCGPTGVFLGGLGREPVVRMRGSYLISGGWWRREVEREYHFAETKSGRLLWLYLDRRRRRWFLQGSVE